MIIDQNIFQYLALAVVFIAVVVRLLKSKGWDLKPMFYENGEFQINTVFIIITGFIASVPILDTVNMVAANTLYLQLIMLWTIFAGVYGTPAGIDGIGTVLNQYKQPKKEIVPDNEDEGMA